MNNRNRQGGRDRNSGGNRFRGGGGFGDGLLGEPPVGGADIYNEQLANQNQLNQLMMAQTLLQQQALAGAGLGGGQLDLGGLALGGGLGGSMQGFMQSPGGHGGHGGGFHGGHGGGHGGHGGGHGGHGGGHGGHGGGMQDRKRMANRGRQDRNYDNKRRRQDSTGRSDRDRSRDGGRGDRDRDRNRSNQRDSEKADYDPAEPTEDDESKVDKDSNLYCHVCNVSVYDDDSFRRHLNGSKHQQRMNNVLAVHQVKSNQLKSRLKAEEHLRKIEGGVSDPDFFCKICNNDLTVPWRYHSTSHIHRQRLLQVRRGCGWCGVHDFNNFTEVLEHRETKEHKKNAAVYGKKEEKDKKPRSGKEDPEQLKMSGIKLFGAQQRPKSIMTGNKPSSAVLGQNKVAAQIKRRYLNQAKNVGKVWKAPTPHESIVKRRNLNSDRKPNLLSRPAMAGPLPETVDEFECFGQSVSHGLRSMNREQFVLAKKLISDVLYEGQLGNLGIQGRFSF